MSIGLVALAIGATGCSLDPAGRSATGDTPGAMPADASTVSAIDASGSTGIDGATANDDAGDLSDSSNGSPDVGVEAPDASDASVAPDGSVTACDQDGDGHKALGSVCNGDDCCDTDSHAYPGEPSFYDHPSACGSYDFDCDGKQTAEFGVVSCTLGFFACSGDGFKTETACGSTQAFEQCNLAFASCSKSEATKTQGCK